MNVTDLKKLYGSQNKAAKALKLHKSTISVWKDRGIPKSAQYRIQVLTDGKLRASR